MSLFYPESVLNNSCSLYIHFKIKFNTRPQPKLGKQVFEDKLWDNGNKVKTDSTMG